jgi:hypothetical protein
MPEAWAGLLFLVVRHAPPEVGSRRTTKVCTRAAPWGHPLLPRGALGVLRPCRPAEKRKEKKRKEKKRPEAEGLGSPPYPRHTPVTGAVSGGQGTEGIIMRGAYGANDCYHLRGGLMPPSPLCPVQDELKRASRQRGLLACVAQGDRLSWISVHIISFLFFSLLAGEAEVCRQLSFSWSQWRKCLSTGVASANPSPNATGLQWPLTVFVFRFTCRDSSVSRTSAWTGRSLASSPTPSRTQCEETPSAPRGSRGWPQGAARVHTFVERGSASAQSADSISMVVMPIYLVLVDAKLVPIFHRCRSCTANFRRCMADHKEQQPCPRLRHQRQFKAMIWGRRSHRRPW